MRLRRPALDSDLAQLRIALDALSVVEARSTVLPDPVHRTMVISGRQAAGMRAHPAVATLPDHGGGEQRGGARVRRVIVGTSATLVRLSAFSTSDSVRARAFFLDEEPPVTVKVRVGADAAALGREVASVRRIAAGTALRVPEVLDAAATTDLSYVVEPVVSGSHARTRAERRAVASTVIPLMLQAHRELGVSDETITSPPGMTASLDGLFAAEEWQSYGIDMARLREFAEALVTDDTPMPVGWCHGDLTYSNIIRSRAGDLWVIDWEHGGRFPAATDVARLAVGAPVQAVAIEDILRHATPADLGERPGCRRVVDQLALMAVWDLSRSRRRARRAVAVNRVSEYQRGVRRRLSLLSVLAGRT